MSADEDLTASSDSYRFLPPGHVAYSDALGTRRTFGGLGLLEWAFLGISTLNILGTIGITIERIVTYSDDPEGSDFTFALVLLVNAVFCLFYVYNGILREQTFEILAFVGGVMLVLCYCVLEYAFNVAGRNPIKLGRLIASSLLAPVNIFLAWKVFLQFGWLEFRIVGASEALQHMYRQQRAFFSLQRFDFQAAVSFVLLVLEHGVLVEKRDMIVLSIGLIFSALWFVVGWFAVTKESPLTVWFFGVLGFLEPAYIISKVSVMYVHKNDADFDVPSVIFYALLGVGAVAFVVRFVLMIELLIVYRNFDNGLGDRAFQQLVSCESTALLPGRSRRKFLRWF